MIQQLLVFFLVHLCAAKRLPQIYWNSTNPLVERYAAIGDTLDILCPYSEEGLDAEQSIIYRVSEEEYERCEVRSDAVELGRCTAPERREKLKVAFRLISPNPSALVYRPGITYFFISTSTGSKNGLNNQMGGLCASHNLKMVIHITDKNGDISGHHHRHHHRKVSTTTTTESPAPTTEQRRGDEYEAEKLWEQFYEKVMPARNMWPEASRAERVTLYAGDKKDEYEQAPADVMDFEIHEIGDVESLYSSSATLQNLSILTSLILLLL
ncbi:unnamed protein product [Caenorhabditis bovis]|uniref:Ephrin RBD domain-containing protein n=1 Tax=Caenorhabditis bovis TaxID=2654633 RepID=A0A8S1F0C0_9PELO|nr:unnamed protein product [Caenorhabditis bovis]